MVRTLPSIFRAPEKNGGTGLHNCRYRSATHERNVQHAHSGKDRAIFRIIRVARKNSDQIPRLYLGKSPKFLAPSVPITVAPWWIMRARPATAFRAFRLVAWSSVRPARRKKIERCYSIEIGVGPASKGVDGGSGPGRADSPRRWEGPCLRCASKPNSMPKRKKSTLNRPQRALPAGPRSGGNTCRVS